MNTTCAINDAFIAGQNRKAKEWLDEDYEHLGRQLRRRGVEIENLTARRNRSKVPVRRGAWARAGRGSRAFPGWESRAAFTRNSKTARPSTGSFARRLLSRFTSPGTNRKTRPNCANTPLHWAWASTP